MPRATVKCNPAALLSLRAQRGLTQEEVAKRAGYSKRQYERLESGSSTTLDTVACFAEVLDCPVYDLIDSSMLQVEAGRLGVDPQQLVADHFRKKELSKKMKDTTLSTLLSNTPERVLLVIRTASKGDISLMLRPEATIGELTHAVPKEYLAGEYPNYEWLLTDSDGDQYDITMTIGDLAGHSVSVVYLRKHQGLLLGMGTGPSDRAVRWCAAIAAVILGIGGLFKWLAPGAAWADLIARMLFLLGCIPAVVVISAVAMSAFSYSLLFLGVGIASGYKRVLSYWKRRQFVRVGGQIVFFVFWVAFALLLAIAAIIDSIVLTFAACSQEIQMSRLEKWLAKLDQDLARSLIDFLDPIDEPEEE